MFFIQESDKPSKVSKIFNILKIDEDKIILPINEEKLELKKASKLAIKTKKILDLANCNKIIISKKIKEQPLYINYLNSYNIEIVDGKWLFEVLSYKIIEYISKVKKIKKEELSVSILINKITETSLYNIRKIATSCKRVNIVTNHIELFKKLEKQILDEDGIMITITNNKRKSLSKSNIILNIDFPQELINQYNIFDEAIIVNIQGNIKIKKKRFNGMCVNDYEIQVLNDEEFDYDKEIKYNKKDVYEANMYKKQPMENIMRKIERDKVRIVDLLGENTTMQGFTV